MSYRWCIQVYGTVRQEWTKLLLQMLLSLFPCFAHRSDSILLFYRVLRGGYGYTQTQYTCMRNLCHVLLWGKDTERECGERNNNNESKSRIAQQRRMWIVNWTINQTRAIRVGCVEWHAVDSFTHTHSTVCVCVSFDASHKSQSEIDQKFIFEFYRHSILRRFRLSFSSIFLFAVLCWASVCNAMHWAIGSRHMDSFNAIHLLLFI